MSNAARRAFGADAVERWQAERKVKCPPGFEGFDGVWSYILEVEDDDDG